MAEKIGLGHKEQAYLKKWSAIRAKGKPRYILTRGILFGIFLFAVWLSITLIEINMSEFKKTLYSNNPEVFFRTCMIWFVSYFVFGFVIAFGSWKGREEKYHYLS